MNETAYDMTVLLAEFEAEALRQGATPEATRRAAAACRKRFLGVDRLGSARECDRARAYFRAVVRNALVRDPKGSAWLGYCILESVVAELRRTGRDDAGILDELRRGWGDAVDPRVMDRFIARLSAQGSLPLAS